MAYVKSYRDLDPSSPTNYLAISALVQATIALAVAAACLVIAVAVPAALSTLAGSTLIITEGTVVLIGVWSASLGVIAFRNARRNHQLGGRAPVLAGEVPGTGCQRRLI